jgi:hypothetical protein
MHCEMIVNFQDEKIVSSFFSPGIRSSEIMVRNAGWDCALNGIVFLENFQVAGFYKNGFPGLQG